MGFLIHVAYPVILILGLIVAFKARMIRSGSITTYSVKDVTKERLKEDDVHELIRELAAEHFYYRGSCSLDIDAEIRKQLDFFIHSDESTLFVHRGAYIEAKTEMDARFFRGFSTAQLVLISFYDEGVVLITTNFLDTLSGDDKIIEVELPGDNNPSDLIQAHRMHEELVAEHDLRRRIFSIADAEEAGELLKDIEERHLIWLEREGKIHRLNDGSFKAGRVASFLWAVKELLSSPARYAAESPKPSERKKRIHKQLNKIPEILRVSAN